MGENEPNWMNFVQLGRKCFDSNLGSESFRFIEILDNLYRTAYRTAPFPKIGQEEADFFHMCFMICHRALLSAATAIGSGHTEDGPAITRRALEAAKVALAIKADSRNFAMWKAFDERTNRWKARSRGEKPKKLKLPNYDGVHEEPLWDEVQALIGVVSDYSVHFTLEYVSQYEWEATPQPDGRTETRFGVRRDSISYELLMLGGQHRVIMHVFDRCLDGKLFDDLKVRELAERALMTYKELLCREGYPEESTACGETW